MLRHALEEEEEKFCGERGDVREFVGSALHEGSEAEVREARHFVA